MPKLKHYDGLGTARFVTFCCYRMEPYLNDHLSLRLVIEYVDAARERHGFKLLAYVIMPEHVHLVMVPPDEMRLGVVIGEIKSRTARDYFAQKPSGERRRNVFWQKRCYDHNCRTAEKVREKITYCHNNPVRRGLAPEPGAYRWSSYNWYEGVADVPLEMDEYELY